MLQVLTIKTTFEKNLRDLYLLYFKSPKYGEFNFCRFWGYLNYNDYYSNTFNKEMGHFYMSWYPEMQIVIVAVELLILVISGDFIRT